jgi:hypothetical protein
MTTQSEIFKLFGEFWKLLDGENQGGVSVENLLIALLIVRGAKCFNRECEFKITESRDPEVLNLAFIGEDGVLSVAPGGSEKIFVHFKDFWVNR